MAQHLLCYHHSNCLDVPAVGQCSVCGKGLCKDCVDMLRSNETGKPVCTDCLTAEYQQYIRQAEILQKFTKKEWIRMMVFTIIGGGLFAVFAITALFANLLSGDVATGIEGFGTCLLVGVYGAGILTSLVPIIKTLLKKFNILLWLPAFIVGLIISPIILVVRIIKNLKTKKLCKNALASYKRSISLIQDYLLDARSISSGRSDAEQQKFVAEQLTRLQAQLELRVSQLETAKSSNDDASVAEHEAEIRALKDRITVVSAGQSELKRANQELAKQLSSVRDTQENHGMLLEAYGEMNKPARKAKK